ncbi:hypothetical protein ACFLTH_08755 [Bacteroidota bacterium]
MKRSILLFIVMGILLASCTPGPNYLESVQSDLTDHAGFWLGLWHGFTSLFTFIGSLFSDNISMYEVYNNGTWYNLGFLIGVSTFFGGGSTGACKKGKWKWK